MLSSWCRPSCLSSHQSLSPCVPPYPRQTWLKSSCFPLLTLHLCLIFIASPLPAFLTFSNAITLLIEPNPVYSCGLTAKGSIPFPFSLFSDPLFSVSQFQFSTSNSSTFFPHVCTRYYYSKPHQHLPCLSLTHTKQYLGVFLPILCVWHLVLCNTDTRISSFRCTLIFRVSYTSSSLVIVHSFLLWKVFFIVFSFDLMERRTRLHSLHWPVSRGVQQLILGKVGHCVCHPELCFFQD